MSARIISTVGSAIDVIVAGRLVSHLRFAAGVCVLAAALLMASAGGAVAVADPDSSGSAAPGDGGTNASGQGGTTVSSPVGDVTGTLRKTIQRVTSTLGLGRQPGQQPSTGAKSPRKSLAARTASPPRFAIWSPQFPTWSRRFPMWSRRFPMWSRRFPMRSRRFPMLVGAGSQCGGAGSQCGRAGSQCGGAGSQCGGAGSECRCRRFPMRAAPIPNLVGPVSDVIAPVQDMLTSVAGAVVPLTQLQSDLSSFLLGIAGVEPVEDGCRHRPCWAVGDRGCVGGVAIAAGPPPPCPGRAGGRQHRDCNAPGDCGIHFRRDERGRSSVIAARDGTASAQWRHSDGCAVVSPACRQRPPGSRFGGGAGRCRSARRRRACDPYPGRGAHRIPPGQSRFRIADSGHRALRRSGAVRCRPIGVIGCRPSAGIARRPRYGSSR